jgi:uncharacterized integral membrane protein
MSRAEFDSRIATPFLVVLLITLVGGFLLPQLSLSVRFYGHRCACSGHGPAF